MERNGGDGDAVPAVVSGLLLGTHLVKMSFCVAICPLDTIRAMYMPDGTLRPASSTPDQDNT